MNDSVSQLYRSILMHRDGGAPDSRTARLFQAGSTKIAKKLVEEAVEVGFEALKGRSEAVVLESADLLYNLCVLWAAAGVTPQQVFAEVARREKLFGIAEKLPKRRMARTQMPRVGPSSLKV